MSDDNDGRTGSAGGGGCWGTYVQKFKDMEAEVERLRAELAAANDDAELLAACLDALDLEAGEAALAAHRERIGGGG